MTVRITFQNIWDGCVSPSSVRIHKFLPHLNAAASRWNITTRPRLCAWLATVLHESGDLRYVREIASGAAYDTGRAAMRLGNTPERDGDGQRYKGRGLIQVTGKTNYARCGKALGLDLIERPELLEQDDHAAQSAGWYWDDRKLNDAADEHDFLTTQVRVNGRMPDGKPNHWSERLRRYTKLMNSTSWSDA